MTNSFARIRALLAYKQTVLISAVFVLVLLSSIVFCADRYGLLGVSALKNNYAELYFTAPSELPTQFSSDSTYEVDFTIVNHEESSKYYRYAVEITEDGVTRTTKTAGITLASNERANNTAYINTYADNSDVTITIRLLDANQSIHFGGES